MSIHNRLNEAYRHQILNDFEDNQYYPKTPEGLLEFLYSDESNYKIYHYKDIYTKSIWQNRLNRIWVVPIWFVIAPFKWLFTGSSGVNQHTKLGKWLAKITGL